MVPVAPDVAAGRGRMVDGFSAPPGEQGQAASVFASVVPEEALQSVAQAVSAYQDEVALAALLLGALLLAAGAYLLCWRLPASSRSANRKKDK